MNRRLHGLARAGLGLLAAALHRQRGRLSQREQDLAVRERDAEHARLDEVLGRTRRQLATVTDNATVALFIMDERQHCTFMNPAAEKLTGFTLDEVRGRPLHEFVHHTRPDGRPYPIDECPIDRALPEKNQTQGEEVFVHKGGHFYRVAFTASPLVEHGRPVGTVIEARDVTEEKRLRRELDAAHARLEAFFAAASIGIALLDHELRFVRINDALAHINGAPIEAHLGRTVFEMLPAFPPETEARLRDVVESGRAFKGLEIELETPLEPGITRFFRADYFPAHAGGESVGVGCVVIEITDMKQQQRATERARAEADAANRAKDEFLAMLGHELRNPLAPILTAVELMRMRGGQPSDRERGVIERQARHLAALVDDLLDISRITRGKIVLKREPVEVGAMVGRAVETAGPLLEERRHEIVNRVPPRGLVVEGDPARLVQVFSNLVTNAAKYTDPGGRIVIDAEQGDERIAVRVTDTGRGIAAEMIPRIFDPFVQEEQDIDRARGGLGLGLAIVKNLVEQHGGRVVVHSEGPGQGSSFTVELPAAEGAAARGLAGRPEEHPAAEETGPSVLVVDDNADAAAMLAAALEELGCTTRVAHDPPSALRLAATQRAPALALLDIGLPVMDGYELARRLRELSGWQDVRFVAVTGYGQESDRRCSEEAGFAQHLVKPVTLDALARVLDLICARRAA